MVSCVAQKNTLLTSVFNTIPLQTSLSNFFYLIIFKILFFQELIPEFYDTSQNGDFLLNNMKINFGHRHDGTAVNNVVLPPWAKNSPALFIAKLRLVFDFFWLINFLYIGSRFLIYVKTMSPAGKPQNLTMFHKTYTIGLI